MKKLITIFTIICVGYVIAQCPTSSMFIKVSKKEGFSLSSQSRSAAVMSDTPYEMSFIAQAGMDYKVTAAAQDATSGTISYEIYESSVKKVNTGGKDEYKKVKTVLMNSSEKAGPLEFTSTSSKKIIVSVSANSNDKKKAMCVGVLVENKAATKLGF